MGIFDALLSGSSSRGVDPELLETLGRQAASRHLNAGQDLSRAVVDLASQNPHLENEHIKRDSRICQQRDLP